MFQIRYETSNGVKHEAVVCADFLKRALPALAADNERGNIGSLAVYSATGQQMNKRYGLPEFNYATTIEPLDSRPVDVYSEFDIFDQADGPEESEMLYEGQAKYHDAA